MRWYADPAEGLLLQLVELGGLIEKVPPLIQADRENRWAEASRLANEYEEMPDAYERRSGPSEGYGYAEWGRTICSSALVFAWETFAAFVVAELVNTFGLDNKRRDRLEHNFDLVLAECVFRAIDLSPYLNQLAEIRMARHAIVHNLGLYSEKYLRTRLRRLPSRAGATVTFSDPTWLLNRELIPIDAAYVEGSLETLGHAAILVRKAVHPHWLVQFHWLRDLPSNSFALKWADPYDARYVGIAAAPA